MYERHLAIFWIYLTQFHWNVWLNQSIHVAIDIYYSYECSAKNAVGIAKRTVQLVVRTEAPALPPPPPPTAALIPRPHEHDAIPRPSQQHLVSAMYGSTVFLHCPESTESTRGTIWQLPSKTIMDQYRSVKPSSSSFKCCLIWMNFKGVFLEYDVEYNSLLFAVLRDPSLCFAMGL